MEAVASPAPAPIDPDGSAGQQVVVSLGPSKPVVSEPVELPRQRVSGATLAALAAIAGVGAIGLGLWAFVSTLRSEDSGGTAQTAPIDGAAQALSLLSKRDTKRLPLDGTGGRMVLAVGASGRGALVLDGLGIAPVGMSYQAWVVKPKTRAVSAAVFSGDETVVLLRAPVPRGSVLGVTLEEAGGVPAPTKTLRLVARRPS